MPLRININRSLEVDSNPPCISLRGIKTSMEKVTAELIEIARELELEMEPEDVAELLQSHDKTWMDEKLVLRSEQRKWLLERESTPDEGTMKIVEMTKRIRIWHKLSW